MHCCFYSHFPFISGSCKIQQNCTAGIKITTKKDNTVLAEICHTHYGHTKEVQHIGLSKGKREEIAAKLQQGISRDKILNDIRDEAMSHGDQLFRRHHLMGRKDLDNIKRSFGLSDNQRHSDDQASVRAWVEEWSSSEVNPILFSKFQGDKSPEGSNLTKDDFLIIIQNPFQRQMAQKFANNGICVDATHGTTGYDFLLTSLVVLDEFGEGLPIAWCLSNHEDFTHMCVFFQMIKQNCGVLMPHWLMSDLASQFYNAWVSVMGGNPRRLLCTWHVDRAWQVELRAKVKDTIVAADIYKMLRTLLQDTNVKSFQDHLAQFEEHLPTLSTEFSSYFQREWHGRAETWAYCYRAGMGINTNMAVEAFHRVFKYNYLKGKVNKRVDNCLISLLRYIRDKAFDRGIKFTKGKSTHKMKQIEDRHNKSKGMCIDKISEDGKFRWLITNDAETTYTVLQQARYCMDNECKLKCKPCKICIHQYVCDCPDSLIHNTMCKHVHLLQRYLLSKTSQETEHSDYIHVSDTPQQDADHDYHEQEVKLVASHIQKNDKTLCEVASIRENINRKLFLITEQIKNCNNVEAFKQLNKQVTAAHHMFMSMKKQECLSPLKTVCKSPANKNIEKQSKFKSTKKKRKRTNRVRFAKPTREDTLEIFDTNQNGWYK